MRRREFVVGLASAANAAESTGFPQPRRQAVSNISVSTGIACAVRSKTTSEVDALILGTDFLEPLFGLVAEVRFGRQQKQRDNALAHVPDASQFWVMRQTTTRQAPADARNSSRHLAPPISF
jgi:hypothetical protein